MTSYTSDEIQEKVVAVVARALRLNAEEISADSHLLRDLSADSLDTLNIAEQLEEAFDVEIPNDVAQEFMTVQAIVAGIEKLTNSDPTD